MGSFRNLVTWKSGLEWEEQYESKDAKKDELVHSGGIPSAPPPPLL